MKQILESHLVPDRHRGERLEQFLLEVTLLKPSMKSVRKAVKAGKISVNGETVYRRDFIVEAGQRIEVAEISTGAAKIFPLKVPVRYEDDHLAVVEKPPGVQTNGNRFRTLERLLPANLAPSMEKDALTSPRPVHRLDRATGGLVLAAKTASAMVILSGRFRERAVHKKYSAVVSGRPPDEGLITAPVDGRPAETRYRVTATVPSLKNGSISLVELFPLTGRTHQLRIHMTSIGHPIMGDPLYSAEGLRYRGKGLFLHAAELSFAHPATGEEISVIAELPEKFRSLMRREETRWRKYNR